LASLTTFATRPFGHAAKKEIAMLTKADPSPPRILALATKGTGTNEEDRLRLLLSRTNAEFIAFDKTAKKKSCKQVLSKVFRDRPDLLVMEGTGLAGGLVCLLARIFGRTRYVISSGDAVGPFVAAHSLLAGPIFAIYERLLCRLSDGFIGWTPYLTGRALTFGSPRGITACGFAPAPLDESKAADARQSIRQQLGIPADAIVFGIAGALGWNPRRGYCYGLELVQAIQSCSRTDICLLIVGGGSGLDHLKKLAGDRINKTVFFTGQVPGTEVSRYLAAMDYASLPQSRDGVGMFRYTTKISEYAAAGLPIVTGRLPLAYDLDDGTMIRLPGFAPWSPQYITAMADLMNEATVTAKTYRIREEFDPEKQVARVTRFIEDLLQELPRKQSPTVEPRLATARRAGRWGLRPLAKPTEQTN
jgi:glycosyltransferase involved in cell wall biosynthesis